MKNILYTGDNLDILHGLDSESIDLVYLDPPFNSKRMYAAPVGSKAAGASFKDMWTWRDVDQYRLETLVEHYAALVGLIKSVQAIHGKAMASYLTYMTLRLIELKRVLKPTGSIYMHCDPTASHYLKVVMDEIFGRANFRNEIAWCYKFGGHSKKGFAKKHDIILRYSKSNKFVFNEQLMREFKTKSNWGQRKDGKLITDWWEDIPVINTMAKERTGYPTQKPLALMDRIIRASSNEDDMVLDPFCGCATTCVQAQILHRRWIGIDVSAKAAELVQSRLTDMLGLIFKDFVHIDVAKAGLPMRSNTEKTLASATTKKRLLRDYGAQCNGCGEVFEARHLEIDHIIPRAKGGGNYYENYQLLCGNCNRIKGARPMEYLRHKIKRRARLMDREITFGR